VKASKELGTKKELLYNDGFPDERTKKEETGGQEETGRKSGREPEVILQFPPFQQARRNLPDDAFLGGA
jgi:hypothetical protein